MADIDFNTALRDFDGSELLAPDGGGEGKPLRLCSVCVNALHAVVETGAKRLSGEEKIKRGILARRIYRAAEFDKAPLALKSEDISMLKASIADAYPSPRVVTGAWELLDPASVPSQI